MEKAFKFTAILIIILSYFCTVAVSQVNEANNKPNPSLMVDTSLVPKDTSGLKPWELVYADSIPVDTVHREPPFSFIDSLSLYFLTDRFDFASHYTKSYGHDAGDFLSSNASNFIVAYQPLPMRKTVSPFGLPGNRLDVILGGQALHPVEHLIEPDNQIGFEEIPTAPVQKIFNIEGPLGKIFGGDNGTASLIMLPVKPKSSRAESELFVDVGDFGFANTKAVITEQKKSGKLIQLAAEYRRSDGFSQQWGDSSYHHWADIIYPIGTKINLNLNGRLFRRRGKIPFRPEISNDMITRNRRDRDFSASFDYSFSSYNKSTLGVRHQKSETETRNPDAVYHRDIEIIDNAVFYSHETALGNYFIRHELFFTEEEYHNFDYFLKRHRAKLNSSLLIGDSTSSKAVHFSFEKVGGFDPAPSFVLAYKKENELFYFSLSAGYVTKFPRQYELDLTPQIDRFVDGVVNDYYESGNVYLKPERQLSGNLTIGLGRKNNDLTLSITGGKLFDAIDWVQSVKNTVLIGDLSLTAFKTENRDIEFANLSLTKRLSLSDKLFWTGSGSYRYVSIDGHDNPPYSPDYQLFTGLELYHYVKYFDIHFYGYIETGYIGKYESYPAFGLQAAKFGEQFVTNFKFSFRVKSFRFYWYWQNLFANRYQLRQHYGINDLLVYYGFTWNFLD